MKVERFCSKVNIFWFDCFLERLSILVNLSFYEVRITKINFFVYMSLVQFLAGHWIFKVFLIEKLTIKAFSKW